MRQAIGGTWIMQLVIIFMLIFVSFLALSINYTKAFRMKNELLTIIEKYEGVKDGAHGSISIINNYLSQNNHYIMGKCQKGEYGVSNLQVASIEEADGQKKYYYCIKKISTSTAKYEKRAKYEVSLFFKFNLPVLGDILTFKVNGNTINIVIPADNIVAV